MLISERIVETHIALSDVLKHVTLASVADNIIDILLTLKVITEELIIILLSVGKQLIACVEVSVNVLTVCISEKIVACLPNVVVIEHFLDLGGFFLKRFKIYKSSRK